MATTTTVIDVSHHNTISDWNAVKADGIVAIIHKATEGLTVRDKEYLGRRDKAKSAGLLWGSYHFSSGDDPLGQLENYLTYATPQPDELICIDFEPSSGGPNMTLKQLEEFVGLVKQETGRLPVVYGGSLLRESLNGTTGSIVGSCPLWYARYAASPFGVPPVWNTWTMWQYTDGNLGNKPHDVPGIGNCDRDIFNGSDEDLKANWPLT